MVAIDYFAVFGLPPAFAQDLTELEHRYLDLQRHAHPDRYAHQDAAQRRAAAEAAAHINEAYRQLKDPLARSTHLLALRGVEVLSAGSIPLPADFLLQQMDWHEALDTARRAGDASQLSGLTRDLRAEWARLESRLSRALDEGGDNADAAATVRQLMFLRRLIEQAQSALEIDPHRA
ncbi:MAG TPA: Fe-S protein assembly co-chaperone HscB, partial [Gammaproteobacteria bacterium]|nr:Fe-S protein assembly co-chaperone HscB [Gammaproteobacteria bacterium]